MVVVGDRVQANEMPSDSFYKKVQGTVMKINNGYVIIEADKVMDKWSKSFVDHPTTCNTCTKVGFVELI